MNKIVLVIVLLTLGACGPKISASWQDLDAEPKKFDKVAVVMVTDRLDTKRNVENILVDYFNDQGQEAVALHRLIPPRTRKQAKPDPEVVKAKLLAEGFDAVLVTSLVDVEKDTQYNPGYVSGVPRAYYGFGGYYGSRYGMVYEPGYYSTTKTYTLENAFYDLKKVDKNLVWIGQSSLVNPSSSRAYAKNYARAVIKKIESDGIILF
jgi:hypothetical protein